MWRFSVTLCYYPLSTHVEDIFPGDCSTPCWTGGHWTRPCCTVDRWTWFQPWAQHYVCYNLERTAKCPCSWQIEVSDVGTWTEWSMWLTWSGNVANLVYLYRVGNLCMSIYIIQCFSTAFGVEEFWVHNGSISNRLALKHQKFISKPLKLLLLIQDDNCLEIIGFWMGKLKENIFTYFAKSSDNIINFPNFLSIPLPSFFSSNEPIPPEKRMQWGGYCTIRPITWAQKESLLT